MNSWLGFSLSPQELASHAQSLDGAQAVSGECFDHPPGSTSNHFGIMEAFNSGHQHQGHCSMNEMEQYNFICNQNLSNGGNKFEDFLGGQSYDNEQNLSQCNNVSIHSQSFGNPSDYVFSNIGGEGGGSMNGCVGMSTIKTWLRNQPAPQRENENNGGIDMNNISSSGSLSLSMGTCSESSSSMQLHAASGNGGGQSLVGNNNVENIVAAGLNGQNESNEIVPRKTVDTFGQRTSIYRGVTRHRWTGRFEAHLWDNSCRREGQTRKGRQVYLGGYDKEEKAARAYDLAALKYWGTTTTTNFTISDYGKELEEMKNMTRQEYVASLRRKSSGFSRGASIYRGVTRHHQHGRWQARIGRVAGNKDLYLGTFNTQEEAAEAYDIAAIKFRGLNAVTNFEMSRYDVKSILEGTTLPIGGAARRLKEIEQTETSIDISCGTSNDHYFASQLADYSSNYYGSRGWASLPFQQVQPLSMQHPYNASQITGWLKQEHDNVGAHHESLRELHQLPLSNTQNLFQPTGIQNLMGLDPTAFEHSSTLDSSAYFSGDGAATNNVTTFAVPLSSKMDEQSLEGHWRKPGYENDHLNPLHQPTGVSKGNSHEQSGNWMHSSILPLCHGSQAFTVWNDTEK